MTSTPDADQPPLHTQSGPDPEPHSDANLARDTTALVPAAAPTRRRRGARIALVALSLVTALVAAASVWLYLQLSQANALIREQDQKIEQQRELIDEKEAFGVAMAKFKKTAEGLAGLPFASLIQPEFTRVAEKAYAGRWNPQALAAATSSVILYTTTLEQGAEEARIEAATNATGSQWEQTLDQLGGGYVSTVFESIVAQCGDTSLACVSEEEPFLVRVDTVGDADPLTDWMRTGVAYHEFAHVLQFTNPIATSVTALAFGGDHERMADCYALTFLDGWSLDHEVWVDDYSYWQVALGYGYTCNESERQAIRDWNAQIGIKPNSLAAKL